MEIELSGKELMLLIFIFFSVMYAYFAYNTSFLGEDEWTYMKLARDFASLNLPLFNAQGFPIAYPPLISLIFSIPFLFTGISLAVAKIIIVFFGIATICLIYLIGSKLEKTNLKGINIFGISSIFILLSISSFTHFMLLAYVEVPIAFFSLLFLYCFLFNFKNTKDAVFLGITMGISFYMKLSAIFFPIVLFIFAISMFYFKKDKKILKISIISILIFILIISPWVIRNLISFKYPFVEGLNLLFKYPLSYPTWVVEAAKTLSISVDIFSTFSLISIVFALCAAVYSILVNDRRMVMPILMVVTFFLIYYLRFSTGFAISDPRYFSIIFPEVALIGGFFLSKLYQSNKYFLILLLAIFIFSFYISFSTGEQTSTYRRYPDDYIAALTKLKEVSKPNENVFTAYGGSLGYFADRENIWAMGEFPEIMTTTNSTYIYETLKKYNATYILVWRNIVANNYIVPESNLIGAFTPTFINVVDGDKSHFEIVYSNEDNIIWKLNNSYVVK